MAKLNTIVCNKIISRKVLLFIGNFASKRLCVQFRKLSNIADTQLKFLNSVCFIKYTCKRININGKEKFKKKNDMKTKYERDAGKQSKRGHYCIEIKRQ